jgi:deazaflavin-dependent oxidoreductase (nitroreductase family)
MSQAAGTNTERQVHALRTSRIYGLVNNVVMLLARLGIGPFHLLTTRGRKSGRLLTVPVTLVEEGGRRWLVAPYGVVGWVHNARAAGRVRLRRGRTTGEYAIREVGPEEAGPVLKQYIRVASATRPYFEATLESPVEGFAAEADRHPVFELIPVNQDGRATSTEPGHG